MKMLLQGENLTKEQAKRTNPVTLAFVGDAVYALYVRERLVKSSAGKVGDYQRSSAKILSARGQSEFLAEIEELFTEEEKEIFLRGRNAKKATKSKNAAAGEYNRSTGFEAVVGFLYLTGEEERLKELFSKLGDEKFQKINAPAAFKPIR